MDKLISNITSCYGDVGIKWINDLPALIDKIAKKWLLDDIEVFPNLSFNYVVSARQSNNLVALKISIDKQSSLNEYNSLKTFNGLGAVKLINYCDEYNAILMERALPGSSLLEYAENYNSKAIPIACDVIKALQSNKTHTNNFINITEWLSNLDNNIDAIPQEYLTKSRLLRDELIKSTSHEILLHGDLHHDNIILNDKSWIAIDPKGIIGDPTSEYFGIIRNPEEDIRLISQITKYDYTRIKNWCFVRTVLNAVWCAEDNISPKLFIDFLAKLNVN